MRGERRSDRGGCQRVRGVHAEGGPEGALRLEPVRADSDESRVLAGGGRDEDVGVGLVPVEQELCRCCGGSDGGQKFFQKVRVREAEEARKSMGVKPHSAVDVGSSAFLVDGRGCRQNSPIGRSRVARPSVRRRRVGDGNVERNAMGCGLGLVAARRSGGRGGRPARGRCGGRGRLGAVAGTA